MGTIIDKVEADKSQPDHQTLIGLKSHEDTFSCAIYLTGLIPCVFIGCDFFFFNSFYFIFFEKIPDKSNEAQWRQRSPEEPLSAKLNNCLAQLSTNCPLPPCWPTWLVWADDFRQTGVATPAEVHAADPCVLSKNEASQRSSMCGKVLFFCWVFFHYLPPIQKSKQPIRFLPSRYVGVAHKASTKAPSQCSGSTRVIHLNLYCGERGPSSVMTGGRYEGAAFLKRCRPGQQVCRRRTGCCAAVMKAKQKTELMER